MAPDHLVPTPVSSLFSETDFPFFVDSHSKHYGKALASSKPEALANLVNPVSPPSPTLPKTLMMSPSEPPKPLRPSPSPSTLASPLFPTFHSALVKSILADGTAGSFKSSFGSPLEATVYTGSGMGSATLSSPPDLGVHCAAKVVPRSDAADQIGGLEQMATEDSELSVLALKCPNTYTQAVSNCCDSIRANDIASLKLDSSSDSLDSTAPIVNSPGISWSKVVQQNIRGGMVLFWYLGLLSRC